MSTAWFSLRRRLLGLLLGGVAAGWLVMMVFSSFDAHHEVDELFDAQLAQSAQTLLALASHDEAERLGSGVAPYEAHHHVHRHHRQIEYLGNIGEAVHKYQRRLRFQIWHADGSLLLHSENAPKTPLTANDGFSETQDESGHWRYLSLWNPEHSIQVQVCEDHHIRDELIGQIAWRLLLPALIGLPLIGLWVWIATRRGMASLDALARQIASRDPQQLQALTPASAPEEIRAMLEALNGLLARVEQTLEAERRFTADAAHELRTPLAALQAQLQVALRARDDSERDRSLDQLRRGLTRASHLVDQMLQLARLDPESALPTPIAVDLAGLAENVCADLGPLILAKDLDFELHALPGLLVKGQPEWLGVLLRNLVDNAIRYTPAGGRVQVILSRQENTCVVTVSDSGPGIPPDQREAVLRRFHRINQSGEPGSGLGLAIVARIAELHQARIDLQDAFPAPGLLIHIKFPAHSA